MNKLYVLKFDENEVVLESAFEENAPDAAEFKDDYNAAFDMVNEDETIVEDKDEFNEIVKLLLATRKYRYPIYTAVLLMEDCLDTADVINGNVITTLDSDSQGFTMEQLDNLSSKFE